MSSYYYEAYSKDLNKGNADREADALERRKQRLEVTP